MKTFKGFLFENNEQIGFGFIDPSRIPTATRSIFPKPKTMDELISALPSVLNMYKKYGLYPDAPVFQVPGEGAYMRTPTAPQFVGNYPGVSTTYTTINPEVGIQRVMTPGENLTSYPTTPKMPLEDPLKPPMIQLSEPIEQKFPKLPDYEKYNKNFGSEEYSKYLKSSEYNQSSINPKEDIYGKPSSYNPKEYPKSNIEKMRNIEPPTPKQTSTEMAKSLVGRTLAATTPIETVAAETASAAATGLGLGAEMATGVGMLPAVLMAFEQPAGESYEQTLSPSEREAYEERKKQSNIDFVKSLIGTQYNPQGRTPRERTGSR